MRLNNQSLEAIENQGYYDKTPNFWGGVFNFFKAYGGLLLTFYGIFMWITLFARFFGLLSSVNPILNWAFAFFLFVIVQILFLLIATPVQFIEMSKTEVSMIPLNSFRNFGKALPFISEPAVELADTLMGEGTENTSLEPPINIT
jgi:hypothetical protein